MNNFWMKINDDFYLLKEYEDNGYYAVSIRDGVFSVLAKMKCKGGGKTVFTTTHNSLP